MINYFLCDQCANKEKQAGGIKVRCFGTILGKIVVPDGCDKPPEELCPIGGFEALDKEHGCGRKTCETCGNCLMTPNYRLTAACAAIAIQGERMGGYADIEMTHFGTVDSCDKWKPRAGRTCRNVHEPPVDFECSECHFAVTTDPGGLPSWQTGFWGHCPGCGAKVVG